MMSARSNSSSSIASSSIGSGSAPPSTSFGSSCTPAPATHARIRRQRPLRDNPLRQQRPVSKSGTFNLRSAPLADATRRRSRSIGVVQVAVSTGGIILIL
eukprot:1195273-Prorocentrum_minimum.AAC.14